MGTYARQVVISMNLHTSVRHYTVCCQTQRVGEQCDEIVFKLTVFRVVRIEMGTRDWELKIKRVRRGMEPLFL